MQVRIRLPIKEVRVVAFCRGKRRERLGHVRPAAAGEHHAVGDLAGEPDHPPAERREDDRREFADIVVGPVFGDEGADVAERLPGRDAHANVARPMRDPDAELEPAARDLVDIGRAVREFLARLGIDRRDRGGERDLLGGERQRRALRHVAEDARHIEPGKAAPLGFARDIEGDMPPPRHGDQAQGGERLGHRRYSAAWAGRSWTEFGP